ncbi:MAG: zinc-ribbon domain-containing protein, partial [Myxococcales bacterium]|nr:zinc-ribbon domain-containing protein [Myxococcales bacterium]
MLTLIIYGTRAVEGTKGEGTFWCPDCRGQAPYVHKRLRRFFTLYFIPLIPLGTIEEWVECRQCASTYEPSVLDAGPALMAASQGQPQAPGGYPQAPV